MDRFKVIAFTHKSTDLKDLNRFYIEETKVKELLTDLKEKLSIEEICYISTCNRVEFLIVSSHTLDQQFISLFFSSLIESWNNDDTQWVLKHSQRFSGEEAIQHIFHVASSLDSLVVGEREIITQVRKSFDLCNSYGLTGDLLRIILKSTIKTAKEIFTNTQIAKKPISVVSLAYRKLRDLNVKLDARILIVGAGQTNTAMSKYLLKHGFKNFTVFNRTFSKAQELAKELKGQAYPLSELHNYTHGFDVLVSCTGSSEPIISPDLYSHLLQGDKTKKTIIDLAIPYDVDESITRNFNVQLIEISGLKKIASENIAEREKELIVAEKIVKQNIEEFKEMHRTRKVELAMQHVPQKIKEIKNTALNSVFAKDLEQLDANSKEVLEKILSYMEKKYISVPMVIAKEILVNQENISAR